MFLRKNVFGATVRCCNENLFQNSKETSILSVVTGCGNLTLICYRDIFDILQEDRIFRQES